MTGCGVFVGIILAILTTPLVIPEFQAPVEIAPRPVVSILPTQIPPATFTPYPTYTPYPTAAPALVPILGDRCGQFDEINISLIWLDPPRMYVKMPGGVPGPEETVSGDSGDWEYSLEIGYYSTDACSVLEGYPDRLYCDISLPSGEINSIRSVRLYLNGCSQPVYSDDYADIFPGTGSASGGPRENSNEQYSCGAEGASCPSGYYCDTSNEICVPQE
jgi:hypothetical protein